jgi:signal peptidase II
VYAEIMVLAGAISNVIDRAFYQGVIDFVHLHIGDWSWPIFNVADVAIVCGILWMIKEQYQEL